MADKKNNLKKNDKASANSETQFLFSRQNYLLMLVGIAVIIIGFVLMSGTEDIFNTTKLTVAPIVVVIGFIIEVFAIMHRPKTEQ
jgi:F0F1-type ATP synthase assembly protein I